MKNLLLTIMAVWFSLAGFAQKNKQLPSKGDTFTYKKLGLSKSEGERISIDQPKEKKAPIKNLKSSHYAAEKLGDLTVSLTGAMVYEIPISVPSGIRGIAPEISLRYNSQTTDGIAGYGWNIAGLSSISRIPATKYHDNNRDGVDFDDSDRFALDGQRLILKSGTYGAHGAVYETENYSNIKVVSYGRSYHGAGYGPTYFIVYYPDGAKAHYGNISTSRSATTYAITSWEDHKRVRIDYSYFKRYNSIYINEITYGGVWNTNTTAVNKIKFNYQRKFVQHQGFVGNLSFMQDQIIKNIEVFANNVRYKAYELGLDLNHIHDSIYFLRYVNEKSGDNSETQATISFSYNDIGGGATYEGLTTTGLNNVHQNNAKTLSLDITGNGSMDYLVYPNSKNKFWLFKDPKNGSYNYPYEINTGYFQSIFPLTTLSHQGKILSGQNIGIVQNASNNTVNFKVYSNGTVNPIYYQYTKTWSQPTYPYYTTPENSTQRRIPFEYVAGDFNGDGLSEILAVGKPYTSLYCYYHGDCDNPNPCDDINFTKSKNKDCLELFQRSSGQLNENKNVDINYVEKYEKPSIDNSLEIGKPFDLKSYKSNNCSFSCYSSTANYKSIYSIDLKRNVTSGFTKYAGYLQKHLSGNYKLRTGDFNGDGKTDILHVTEDKYAYIYSFDNNNRIKLLWSTYLFSYNANPNYPFLLGDYNGDGKTDILYGTANNSTTFVLGLATGTRFHIGRKTMPFSYQSSTWNGSELNTYYYIPVDANGDGKTDIVRQHAKTYNHNSNGTLLTKVYYSEKLTRLDDPLSIHFFKRGGNTTVSGNLNHYPIPIFLSSEQKNKTIQIGMLSNNWIKRFNFKGNFNDLYLTKLYGGNNEDYEISYNYLDPSLSNQDGIQTYGTGYDEIYPNIDLQVVPNIRVVSMFKRLSDDSPTIKQSFGYYRGVYNVDGLSFLGFKGIAKSNWYEHSNERIFNVSKFDTNLRGMLTEEYSQRYYVNFNYTPHNYISKTTYQNGSSLSSRKVFKSWINSKLVRNNLQGINTNIRYQYDSYNNPININIDYHGQGSSVVNYAYANNTGSPYFIGRATRRTEATSIGGNTFRTEQQFNYSGYQLREVKSKGNGTPYNSVVFEYDNLFGNLIKQTTTPNGEASRIVRYEYDSSGRYLKKHTDVEGLVTKYNYNINTGTLASMTDPFGHTTRYEYDARNRQTKIIDYRQKKISTSYEADTSYRLTVTNNGDDGSSTISKYDQLRRLYEVHKKDVLGQWSKITYEYDKFDRVSRVSQPYTGAQPSQWTENFYDVYGRITERDLYTGKVYLMHYSGLTTTVSDGTKTVSSTMDAMGNIKTVRDPGGTINYSYHGNGQLKSTNYNGVIVSIDIDGWGRKTRLVDPSAGIYRYEYNGFGELKKETNPKGSIQYNYTTVGKLQQKRIYGDQTNMTINYTYHPTYKVISNIAMTSADGNNSTYNYTYNNNVNLTRVNENNPYAQFRKEYTYDDFDRVKTENFYAKLLSNQRSSQKKIVNTYQNGGLKQINSYGDNKLLWKVNAVNARGQITDANYGNVKSINNYNNYGYLSSIKVNKTANNANLMTLNYDFDVRRGLLNSRTNSMFSWSETFGYDDLDRLVTFNDNDGNKHHEYDAFGRITENSSVGSYHYAGVSFQLADVDLNTQGDLFYQNNQLQQVSYNAFKSPHEILQEDKDRIGFQYNAFLQRSHRFYGGFEDNLLQRNKRKHYSFDGSMEITHDAATNKTSLITFIGGDAYSAPAIWKSEQGGTNRNEFYFLHRDHMSSILMVSNQEGNIAEKRHFDAWGNIVKLTDGNGNALEDFKVIDRGYTGHEHLTSVGIVHMNGRLYDPNLKRFLSPDNYIQDMTNTQNFNRYGYVLNNPLMYWDPSGEQTEGGESGGGLLWLVAAIGSSIARSWKAITNWSGWKKIGEAIARPFREIGRFFRRLFGGGKKKKTIREVANPQNLNMDPLARSNIEYMPKGTVGAGQSDIGLKVMMFEMGFKHGFYQGGVSTWKFIKSLGTAQGWKDLGQGFVNLGHLASPTSAQGMIMKGQMAVAVNNYVNKIPTMSAYEIGYDVGYGSEKITEAVLISKGTGLAVNVVKNTALVTRGTKNITYLTRAGNYPTWSTVKSRYWKLMNEGNVPKGTAQVRMRKTGEIRNINVSKELHHINGRTGADPHRFSNLKEVWPWEHEAIDPLRHTGYDFIKWIKK